MSTHLIRCGLSVALSAALAGAAWGASFSVDTADGVGADAFVRAVDYADDNYGAGGAVTIKDAGGNKYTRKGYLRYDVSGVSGKVVTDAALTLEVSQNDSGGGDPTPQPFDVNVFGLNDGHGGEGWGEATITWNNAPANASGDGLTNEATFLGRFHVPAEANPTVTFSSPALAGFLNADTDGQASLVLTRITLGPGSSNLSFAAKENGSFNAPLLTGEAAAGSLAMLTTNDGAGADSFVRKGNANDNYGQDGGVLVKNAGTGSTTRKGYLRFDLSSITQDILQASLALDVTTNNAGGGNPDPREHVVNVFGLADGDGGEGWGEDTITWNNAPANDTADNDLLANAELLGQFIVPAFDVPQKVLFASDELVDFLNADSDGLATLILTRENAQSGWNLGFASGENANMSPPTLRLGLQEVIPEPCTLLLAAVAVGGVGLYGRRRRPRS